MLCPLCKKNSNVWLIFKKDNVFTSVGILADTPFSKPDYSNIELKQCSSCGFIYNGCFDLNKINSKYNSSNYVLKKIVSSAMSKNLKNIFDNISKYINSESIAVEIGSGDGVLARELANKVKCLYTVDPSVESNNIETNKILNIKHINGYFSYDLVRSKLGDGNVDMIICLNIII